jgi:protein-tyrosine phosphatase
MPISLQYFVSGGLLAWWAWNRPTACGFGGGAVQPGNKHPEDTASKVGECVLKASAWYASFCLIGIGSLFVLRRGDHLLGKSTKTGQLPWWSWVLFWPFHLYNYSLVMLKKWTFRSKVEDVSQVLPNWYIGGWFSDGLADVQKWHAIVDLTTEFHERADTEHYLNIPVWDGNPPSPQDIDTAAHFLALHATQGPTLCHCAAGIGRSTTVLCAALVHAGKAKDYKEALGLIKSKRSIVRLNRKMENALQAWQDWRAKAE